MAAISKIEWTDTTWNPVTGCTKVSHGCKNCYAERMSKRLKAMRAEKYTNGFKVTTHSSVIKDPLTWKQPRRVFVNSMSDLFHDAVPISFIESVFHTMNLAERHIFQVLTKRPARVVEINDEVMWTRNIWLGTSIESRRRIDRLDLLKQTSAEVKFLSLEPYLVRCLHFSWMRLIGSSWAESLVPVRVRCAVLGYEIFAINVLSETYPSSSNNGVVCLKNVMEES